MLQSSTGLMNFVVTIWKTPENIGNIRKIVLGYYKIKLGEYLDSESGSLEKDLTQMRRSRWTEMSIMKAANLTMSNRNRNVR